MTWVLTVLLTVATAADVACTESGRDYRDGAHVLQTVRNRARQSHWRRPSYDGTLLDALYKKWQHARGCRWPVTAQHWVLGVQFLFDKLPVERWATQTIWYCGKYDTPRRCAARPRARQVGRRFSHTFWTRPDVVLP